MKRNAQAVTYIEDAFDTIESISSDEFPGLLAHVILKKLMDRYAPTDSTDGLNAEAALAACKQKKKEHPNDYYDRLN